MTPSLQQRLAGRLAASFLLAPARRLHDHHPDRTDLPVIPKTAASLYCILRDYADGLFPPRFDKAALYRSESAYIQDGLEQVESSIRSPFCILEGRPYMNRQKLQDMLKFFMWIDGLKLPRGAKILEVGGGTGWLAELLCVKGYNVVTTTLSPDDTATARLRCDSLAAKRLDTRLVALTAPMEEVHAHVSGEGPFDVAFCHGALHHAFSWQEAIRAMRKCLKPEGFLLLVDEPAWWHTFLCYRSAKIQGRHEIGFFKRPLLAFLRAEGFAVKKVSRRLSLSGPLWIAARLGP